MNWRRTRQSPIGLDIGAHGVRMLQLRERDERIDVCASFRASADSLLPPTTAAEPVPQVERLRPLIDQMFQQSSFSGSRVCVSLPRSLVLCRSVRLPVMPPDDLRSAVELEAQQLFGLSADDAHVDYLHSAEIRQGSEARLEVTLVAARKSLVNDYLERLDQLGVIVDAIDFEACALYRSVERFIRRRDDESEVYVLVDIGFRRTQIVIGRGREIAFYKPIEVGGVKLNEAVARQLGITDEEAMTLRQRLANERGESLSDAVQQAIYDAQRPVLEELAKEITMCLRYYSVTYRGARPARVRFVGGESNDPNLHKVCAASLNVPVESFRPLVNVGLEGMRGSDQRGNLSEWTLALGLALKGIVGTFPGATGSTRTEQTVAQTASEEPTHA